MQATSRLFSHAGSFVGKKRRTREIHSMRVRVNYDLGPRLPIRKKIVPGHVQEKRRTGLGDLPKQTSCAWRAPPPPWQSLVSGLQEQKHPRRTCMFSDSVPRIPCEGEEGKKIGGTVLTWQRQPQIRALAHSLAQSSRLHFSRLKRAGSSFAGKCVSIVEVHRERQKSSSGQHDDMQSD